MREITVILRFTTERDCHTEVWLGNVRQPLEDSPRLSTNGWRVKLRDRARGLLGRQPDSNFSLRGKAIWPSGEEKSFGLWYPGQRKCWFGKDAKERGTLRQRAAYVPDPRKEAKYLAMLATIREL